MSGHRRARGRPRGFGRGLVREVALTGGAVVGTLCLVFALLGATAGVRTLVFTSGSMAPAIDTGDLAVTRPVALAHLSPGDVVSVLDARGARVTHRVVEVDTARHQLRLKGDANEVADPTPYPTDPTDRVDRVLVAVPAGGYVLTWLAGAPAILLLGAYLMFLLSVLRPRSRAGSTAAGLVLVVGLAAGGTARPEPTLAAFTDAVPVGGTTVKAYTVPKPVITDCTTAGRTVTVTFTAVSSPYPLTYSAAVDNGADLPVTGTGGTRTVRYTPALQLTPGATQTIRVAAALPSTTPAWTSTPANQTIRLGLVGLIPSCGAAS